MHNKPLKLSSVCVCVFSLVCVNSRISVCHVQNNNYMLFFFPTNKNISTYLSLYFPF